MKSNIYEFIYLWIYPVIKKKPINIIISAVSKQSNDQGPVVQN